MINETNLLENAREWAVGSPVPSYTEFDLEMDYHRISRTGVLSRYDPETYRARYEVRRKYISEFGFSLPSKEGIERICQFSPLVEVGAGTGFLSRLLKLAGAEVIATDPRPEENPYSFRTGRYERDRVISAVKAVQRWPHLNVLCSWPSYEENWLYRAASKMRKGRTLVYVGEHEGGCTADDNFFHLVYHRFRELESAPIPRFEGMRDDLRIFYRF